MNLSQNYLKWCVVDDDPYLGNFQGLNFASYSVEGFRNNLGNYLRGQMNIIPAIVFPISCYFLRFEIASTA